MELLPMDRIVPWFRYPWFRGAIGVALLLGAGGVGWLALAHESTAAPAQQAQASAIRIVSEGRVAAHPGAEVTLGTDFAGVIEFLRVQEKSRVRKNDVIARIRANDVRAALEEAQAQINEAEVDIAFYSAEVERIDKMWKAGLGNKRDHDLALHNRNAALARRDAADASRRRIAATLAKVVISAPIDGVVTTRFVNEGETVAVGTPLVTIVDLERTRIEAEVDEFDAGRVKLNDQVLVSADGYPDVTWRARVSEVPDAVSERKLRPRDPSLPFDSRVLMVKIELSEQAPLVFGQRVNIEIRPATPAAIGTGASTENSRNTLP